MKAVEILSICLLLSVTTSCAPSSTRTVAPSAMRSLASATKPPATPPLLPTAEPAATRTPRPTSTSAVSDPTDGPSATPSLVLTAEPTATRTSRPTSTPVVVEGIGAVAATVQLPNQGGLFPAVGAGGVWVPGQGILARIDPATMEVVSTIILDGGNHVPGPYAVAVEGANVWATELASKALVRIDPDTNQIADRIELDIVGELHAIALDGATIWVAIRGANQILQVDTAAHQIIQSIPVDDPTSIAIGEGSVWVVEHHKGNVVRIDPNTGSIVARIQLGSGFGSPGQVAVGEGGVWVGQLDGQMVSRVDPETNQETAQIELGLLVYSVKTAPGAVWAVVGPFDGCYGSGIVRIDPLTNRELGRVPVRCAADIAVGPDALWVTALEYGEVTLVTPLQ